MSGKSHGQIIRSAPTIKAVPTGVLQRACACGKHIGGGGDCESCRKTREGTLQRSALQPVATDHVPPMVRDVLNSPGQPLDAGARAFMEPRFGHDFRHVRVHTGGQAAESAKAVHAQAYTVGRDIVFGEGTYAPGTHEGDSLLAHELAHTMQQDHTAQLPSGELPISGEGSSEEHEAERISQAGARGIAQNVRAASWSPRIMRATRTFSLTFDDGPHVAELGKGINLTEKVLDTLKKRGIQAGFFIQTGVSYRGAAKNGKKLVARMAAEGHKVGIHTGGTKDHELHTDALDAGNLATELTSAKAYINAQTGSEPELVRPPTGQMRLLDAEVKGKTPKPSKAVQDKRKRDIEATYSKLVLTNLLWDMDVDQGANLPVPTLKARIKSEMLKVQKAGWKSSTSSANIVVLLHDVQKNTANNLDDLIDHIEKTTIDISGKADTAAFAAP